MTRRAGRVDRSLLTDVLTVVRDLGASSGLDGALQVIAHAVVDVLGFEAAAVNVVTPECDVQVQAVAGPAGLQELLGTRRPLHSWLDLLESAEPWGELRFLSHDRAQSAMDTFPSWIPVGPTGSEPDAWHPEDSLFAPLWDQQRTLVGVLSVDVPRSGRHPDADQCMVLEVVAGQAATAIRDAQTRGADAAARDEVETRWRLAFEQSPAGAALVGIDGRLLQANQALATLLGYSRTELEQLGFADITHPDDLQADQGLFRDLLAGTRDNYAMEKRYLRQDASVVHVLLRIGSIRDTEGRVQTIVGQVSDLTERKQAEQLRAYQRTHDELTGLLNHTGIAAELADRLASDHAVTVLFCDIDRFKTINNSLGRAVGDQVLVAAADRFLHSSATPDATASVARLGNDEFLILMPSTGDEGQTHRLGARLIDVFRQPLQLADGTPHTISISIGAVASELRPGHPDELIADAQEAMRRAKRHGRARIETYDPDLDHPGTAQDMSLDQALRAALDTDNQLQVYLQPIVNIADETVVGSEALIRWQHPQRGLLAPSQFLPAAEHSGLIVEVGWRMLALGTQSAAAQNERSGSRAWVAVNVSGNQLGRGQLLTAVQDALAASGLPPASLHLEFTETALVEATRTALTEIHDIAAMGISIALDDFGTGYSSLSLLRDLPISVVKIDRSFTAQVAHNHKAAALVRSLVSMCDALDITTVAEGIETREQLALISALGCDQAQGYLFGKPEPQQGCRPAASTATP